MKYWEEKWATGGRIWRKKGSDFPKIEIAIVKDDGTWKVNAGRLMPDGLVGAKFDSELGGEAGIDKCLEWVVQLISLEGDPEFDTIEAKKVLTMNSPGKGIHIIA